MSSLVLTVIRQWYLAVMQVKLVSALHSAFDLRQSCKTMFEMCGTVSLLTVVFEFGLSG